MRKNNRQRDWGWIIVGAVWLLFPLVVLLLLCGCTTTKYVPVETVRTKYVDKVKEIQTVDSVTDTRFVYVKGDTVIDWRDRVKWRDRIVHDSIYVERTDSVQVPFPVEKPLTWWQKTKMDFGGMAIGGTGLGLLWLVVWIARRLYRKI